jgi:transcriptional repressor NrdR
MKCPFCAHLNTKVLESRIVEEGGALRRRRECIKCGRRFTTFEKVRDTVLWVIKKSGKRDPFDDIERELLRNGKEEIPSKMIGNAVLKRLKKVDKVAWLRFASVYLEFEDITDFEKTIDKS